MRLNKDITKILSLPDLHDPYQINIKPILDFCDDWKPDIVQFLGDTTAAESCNHWKEKNHIKKDVDSVEEDYENLRNNILSPFNESKPKKAEVIYHIGNHEDWFYQAMLKDQRAKNKYGIKDNVDLKKYKMTVIPLNGVINFGYLHYTHGVYCNKHHAAKMALEYRRCIIYGHCFDDQTELLTKDGFKKYQDVNIGDTCLTMRKDNSKLEWNTVNKKFVYDFNGEMIKLKSTSIDLMVDDGHGMVYKNSKEGGFVYKKASELVDKSGAIILKVSGELSAKEDYPIENNMLKILAWVIAEGSIRYIKNTPYVDIVQSKSEGIKQIKYLLDSLKISYLLKEKEKSPISKLTPYRFRIHVGGSRMITEYIKNKDDVPNWFLKLSNKQFELFLSEYIKGDGTSYSGKYSRQRLLYSNNKKWIDAFQIMLFTNGYKSKQYWRSNGFKNSKPCCQLNIQKKEFVEIKAKNNIQKEHYSGKKWCVNVDNGTLVVRRNGVITITQNTHDVQEYMIHSPIDKKEKIFAKSIGCLCYMNPTYLKNRPNKWANAFHIAYVRKDGTFNDYTIIITNGRFVAPNGKTYK